MLVRCNAHRRVRPSKTGPRGAAVFRLPGGAVKRMTPESPGPFPSPVLELVADLMRQKNHMAVWQHYILLEDWHSPAGGQTA